MDALISGCLAAVAWMLWHPPAQMLSRQLGALDKTFAAGPSLGVILEMMAVAMREGSSIPHALEVIGSIVGGTLGDGLCRASRSLMLGFSWEDAWFAASLSCQKTGRYDGQRPEPDAGHRGKYRNDDDDSSSADVAFTLDALGIIDDALKSTWTRGVSPVGPLESAVEQLDARARATIEQSAQRLSVKLLLPTGLCFLPSFMLIGIIPAIGSFIGH
ncbi:tadC protein [Bifidobacterium sp. ESL0798]|uniref:tadC protein n=1 Tax=Bifidobacterium sp. ESL0798 TaxID=2983235 RepID=UPI0023F938BB|nr:tadC protein [Bifidobacterium sp. ESL0798]WEV73729.1 tadC protein [Bifidobacterium sp. ESL0798]